MLIKAAVIGCALVSTPIIATSIQDPQGKQAPAPIDQEPSPGGDSVAPRAILRDGVPTGATEGVQDQRVAALRAEVARLRSELEQTRAAAERASSKAGAAHQHSTKLAIELQEALDLIVKSTSRQQRRHHNCTPSRSRSLLTYYQWMDQRGHQQHADTMIKRVIAETGNNTSRLNSLAWHLMTEKETQGQFDRAALAVARRMQQQRNLRHQYVDTLALALFLNGHVEDAVKQQQLAVKHSDNSEYRRRLRVYEAAMRNRVAEKAPTNPEVAGGE